MWNVLKGNLQIKKIDREIYKGCKGDIFYISIN